MCQHGDLEKNVFIFSWSIYHLKPLTFIVMPIEFLSLKTHHIHVNVSQVLQ